MTSEKLDYSGNGKVSVSVEDIVKSPKVQKQVEAVKQIEHSVVAGSDSLRTTQDSGSHTQGKLHVVKPADELPHYLCTDPADSQGSEVAVVYCDTMDGADARRLVAAWNACDGIDTETLETVVRQGSFSAGCGKALIDLSAAVECLRELVELKSLHDKIERGEGQRGDGMEYTVRKSAAWEAARQFLATQGKK